MLCDIACYCYWFVVEATTTTTNNQIKIEPPSFHTANPIHATDSHPVSQTIETSSIAATPKEAKAVAIAPIPQSPRATSLPKRRLSKSADVSSTPQLDSLPRPMINAAAAGSTNPNKSWTDVLREADAASPFRTGQIKVLPPSSPKIKSITQTSQLSSGSTPGPLPPSGTPKKLADRRRLSAISDASYTLPFSLGDQEHVLARDADGKLVTIRLAASADDKAPTKPANNNIGTNGGEKEVKLDPRAALNAMLKFGGRGPTPGSGTSEVAPLTSTSSVVSGKHLIPVFRASHLNSCAIWCCCCSFFVGPVLAKNANPERAAVIPRPPPLPTTWPPKPFILSSCAMSATGIVSTKGSIPESSHSHNYYLHITSGVLSCCPVVL